ncbi:hypothetical protein [Streptomyces sp. NPDC050388]|uniref:hypothetical protein n=1 Tax=Streptomyces sp. NPDC050388 TaxID=3155781 RepID=UPI003443300F
MNLKQQLPRRTESGMHTRAINAAAGVLLAAMEQGQQTPTGLALALDSARLLNSPETAAELEQLRERSTAVPSALAAEERAELAEHLGDAKPATTSLIASLAKTVRDVRDHEHPTWEDLYCLNLVSYMGERMAPVLRRLLDTEARVAELEARLAEYDRPVDEDPIAYALTDKAAAEDIVHPCGCPKRFDRHAWGCPTLAAEDDVTPQVAKLRALLAGQREDAAREADDPARCLEVHSFSPRDGWRMICGSCDHGKDAPCHKGGAQ